MIRIHSVMTPWKPPVELIVTQPLETPMPEQEVSGPFFILQSRCEEDPTYTPWFVVMRGQCDVIFPQGTVARPFHFRFYASETAQYCNGLVRRINRLCALQRESSGFLAFDCFQRQIDGLLEEISEICFLTERELAQSEQQRVLAHIERNPDEETALPQAE